jgi:hypothetical protein
VSYQNLSDVIQGPEKRIILRKDEIPRLTGSYNIRVVAEADPLVYAMIGENSSADRLRPLSAVCR